MKTPQLIALVAGVAVVAAGGGYAVGHYTARGPVATAQRGAGNFGGGGGGNFGGGAGGSGGFRRGGRGVMGTVASVSGNTITVNDTRSGTSRSVNLTSSTAFSTGDGGSAAQSDVTTGATILVIGQTGSDGTVTATRVVINPSAPGGAAAGGGSAPSN